MTNDRRKRRTQEPLRFICRPHVGRKLAHLLHSCNCAVLSLCQCLYNCVCNRCCRDATRDAQRLRDLEEEEAEMKAMEKPEDPPPTLRDIPDEIQGLILEKVIEGIAPGDMCGTRLYALCLSIRGSGGCDNPDDDVWRLACARLRVTRSVGTWRETFDALRRLDPGGRATLAGLMQGEDPYGPVEEHAFRVVYGFYEGEELVRLKWYHPFASYLEERWYDVFTKLR